MVTRRNRSTLELAALAVVAALVASLYWAPSLWITTAVAMACFAYLWGRLRGGRPAGAAQPSEKQWPCPHVPTGSETEELPVLFERMLEQGRYALLLRPQIARDLDETQYHRALEVLENGMALVPDGEVVLGRFDEAAEDGRLEDEQIRALNGRVVRVEHFFLDRETVTNRQFAEFVAAGGYTDMGLWEPAIWPAVLQFVDEDGEPGPRFWKRGRCPAGKEDHPVVGVSWYEAAAYARWAGKRLPTDAEWVKAGAWPVILSPHSRCQRKYPWGDTMDHCRVNLWGTGRGDTVPAGDYPSGSSVGGVQQLAGNVWEWTRGDYRSDDPALRIRAEVPLKSIRGGAFDTYFDNQATCQFASGENPLARKPNIGFRCAASVCDLLLARSDQSPGDAVGSPAALEEVSA